VERRSRAAAAARPASLATPCRREGATATHAPAPLRDRRSRCTFRPLEATPTVAPEDMRLLHRVVVSGFAALAALLALAEPALAHGVAQDDAAFFLTNRGPAIGPFMYLGAKHMFTGYDHILFLVGVIFFLYRMKDVVLYVSLFTLGHSLTLLAGVLWGLHANPFLVDAIIGLSVAYKAFDNMDGFRRFLGFQPNTRVAVLTFGLFHGFGLATTLQEYSIAEEGLVTNMLSFNVGVEIGQVLALTFVVIALGFWRTRPGFLRHAFVTNALLMAGGFVLAGYQLVGYFVSAS
jgi:hypothetical protein